MGGQVTVVKRCKAEEVAELGGWGRHAEDLCWYNVLRMEFELDETTCV